ncbi:hypothetical protein [Streptomyces sp. enrichment culture]|uniref:hypothetical protein n=1 Tax=Streptomyces sp. enrichment culture TaxID=1795815 RepID=UPI003F5475A4
MRLESEPSQGRDGEPHGAVPDRLAAAAGPQGCNGGVAVSSPIARGQRPAVVAEVAQGGHQRIE